MGRNSFQFFKIVDISCLQFSRLIMRIISFTNSFARATGGQSAAILGNSVISWFRRGSNFTRADAPGRTSFTPLAMKNRRIGRLSANFGGHQYCFGVSWFKDKAIGEENFNSIGQSFFIRKFAGGIGGPARNTFARKGTGHYTNIRSVRATRWAVNNARNGNPRLIIARWLLCFADGKWVLANKIDSFCNWNVVGAKRFTAKGFNVSSEASSLSSFAGIDFYYHCRYLYLL